MSLASASTSALMGLAVLAMGSYAFVERSVVPVHAEAYRKKLAAVRLMERAEAEVRGAKLQRGIVIDTRNDPDTTGLLGPQFTLITTDRGVQPAKALAANPNFAAAITQMLLEAGVRDGDLVAAGMTGSLPGFNLAFFSACRAIGAEPISIVSLGASMFGATDPEFTWLEMEGVVAERRLWPFRSVAASLGGGGDVGRGLSPAGRQLLLNAIHRSDVVLLDDPNVFAAVQRRVAIYDSIAAARRKPIRVYVNVGGGVVSLGGAQNGRLIPAGLTRRLAARNYPNRGVINVFAERGMPVIHLLQVEKLAQEFGIADGSLSPARPGSGLLFIKYKYNLWLVAGAALLVLGSNLLVLRLDLRHKLLGLPHPERYTNP
jgi:poly-gamma-glutamate system protein